MQGRLSESEGYELFLGLTALGLEGLGFFKVWVDFRPFWFEGFTPITSLRVFRHAKRPRFATT